MYVRLGHKWTTTQPLAPEMWTGLHTSEISSHGDTLTTATHGNYAPLVLVAIGIKHLMNNETIVLLRLLYRSFGEAPQRVWTPSKCVFYER